MRGGERLKSPQQYVEWCNLEHMPLIQLHSLTNLSPPLISHDKISVPKCRYFIVTASPRGKPRRLRRSGRQIGDPYRGRVPLNQDANINPTVFSTCRHRAG